MATERRQKRRFPRIAAHLAVLVKKLGDAPVEEIARTKSMGLGGCAFISSETLPKGSELEILIAVDRRVVKARGRVVYQLALNNAFEVGVEFLAMRAADRRILEKLFEKAPPKTRKRIAVQP
ncbi:MAG TPA: PilZ domain-containing protein [Thermoanaerobaculia bacterium]|nr:PilZ domain-containing protein [Thermoanaerobaculia bacterium]